MRNYLDTTVLLTVVWCVLNEDFSFLSFGRGFAFALVTVILVRILFSNNTNIKNYRIRPTLFIWYLGSLIYHIIKSALITTRQMIRHEVNPTVVEIKTTINNHWFQCLIANSITLTPGTVTIDKTDHSLRVLWLYPTTTDPKEAAEAIMGPFEAILKKGDFKK